MPTPGGKPQVGDRLLRRNGALLGTVTRRSPGEGYAVWVEPAPGSGLQPDSSGVKIITEFEWWRDANGWTVAPPATGPVVDEVEGAVAPSAHRIGPAQTVAHQIVHTHRLSARETDRLAILLQGAPGTVIDVMSDGCVRFGIGGSTAQVWVEVVQ